MEPESSGADAQMADVFLTYKGRRYNIAKFVQKHPGGANVFQKLSGQNIDSYFDGTLSLLDVRHSHSKSAERILHKYCIEQDHKNDKEETVDIEKPIVGQVWRLGGNYWTWIHEPVDKELRMFESGLLEYFSRTKWFIIPIVWMPLVLLLGIGGLKLFIALFRSFFLAGCVATVLFLLGILGWTLIEYALHRFAFHWHPDPNSPRMITLHFVLHGLHHKTPMDKGRLVFPPPLAAVIVVLFYLLYSWLLPWSVCLVFAAGNLFGYICYDVCHYYLHHGSAPPNSYRHKRKIYHHAHHFKDVDTGYGISTQLWDYVFGTMGVAA